MNEGDGDTKFHEDGLFDLSEIPDDFVHILLQDRIKNFGEFGQKSKEVCAV